MAIKFTQETEIEKEMIETLTSGDSQWNYHPEIRTEQALWDNFFDILHKNNVSGLDNIPLTEDEKEQIRTKLNFSSFYDAGVWLSGENGVAQVQIQRSDAKLGIVNLMVHNANDIAGGSSVYQVINQLQRDKRDAMDRNRRMDVTLLINGLPLIHIELKSRSHGINEAFEQIKKYDAEKKFSGLLSLTQIFIVSNGSNTEYIAANKHYRLDPNYLSAWVNIDNKSVRDLVGFTREVLSIPMAHELVTDYTVLDSSTKSLIVMRPYQIHATKAVLNALKNDESGYIWHTTGSGKTLTSYKTSKTILRRMSLDKVLFLVDRKDLDAQTTGTFESYAQNDTVQVDGTSNVTGLVDALLRPGREVIVTTAQKLNHLLKRYERENLSQKQLSEKARLRHMNLAFVVDECHRAVSSEQQRNIDRFFQQPVKLWYGFTGTPIFTQNKKTVKGDLDATTPDQYGRELHRYTVKEAIHDKNVLSFHVEYSDTLDEDSVYENLIKKGLKEDYVYGLTRIQIEERLTEDFFESENHMLEVIEQIINRSTTKLGLHNGSGQTYSGILTVPSINRAQAYYRLFKQVINGEIELKVNKRVKRLLADFPKIALTYSLSENKDGSLANQEVMVEAMTDYNQMFGTNYTLETINLYNYDLTQRLARKNEKYQIRKEQLDLVIVVDRLLTGFDAPSLSTLFIDRPIMPEHTLIQAFSRTNRLHGNKKANIVTFRTPDLYKLAVKESIRLYSAGQDPSEVMAPEWDEAKQTMIDCLDYLFEVLDSVDDVLDASTSVQKKEQFAKAFQQVDKAFNDIQVYTEYVDALNKNENYLEDEFKVSPLDLEHYKGLYVNVIDQLKVGGDGDGDVGIDVEYRLASRYREEIDHDYILALMDRHSDDGLSYDEEKEVDKYIKELSEINPKLGKLLLDVWNTIKTKPELVEGRRAIDILNEYQEQYIANVITQLADDWLVPHDMMEHFVRNYNPARSSHFGWTNVRSRIRANYDKDHNYPAEGSINSLTIRKKAEDYIFEILNDEIVPLKYR